MLSDRVMGDQLQAMGNHLEFENFRRSENVSVDKDGMGLLNQFHLSGLTVNQFGELVQMLSARDLPEE